MKASALTCVAAATTALAVVLSGCGSDTKTSSSSSSSKESSTSSMPPAPPPAPGQTIDQYIAANKIPQIVLRPNEDGAPNIKLPTPEGWTRVTENLPKGAYGGIKYTGPDAAPDFPPTIFAYLSRLGGNVDPVTILGLTPNDLGGMAGYEAVSPGAPTKFSGFDAYQLAGTAPVQNRPTFLAVKSVMIPGKDGASYLFQLNAVSKPEQQEIVGAAMGHIDTETTIN